MTDNEPNQLKVKNHVRCHSRFLGILPTKYQSEDSNTLAIAYFSLSSLELLQSINQVFKPLEIEHFIEYIYAHLIETEKYAGFRGSLNYSATESSIELAATCFAFQCLLILKDDLKRVPVDKVMRTVSACQASDGGFKNTLIAERSMDLRYCMIATTISKILLRNVSKIETYINVQKLKDFVFCMQNFDGGFGMCSGDESHGGMIFCAVDTLALLEDNQLKKMDNGNRFKALLDFLAHRQISYDQYNVSELKENEYADVDDNGGFNGRLNKYADTCYMFWTLGSLNLLKYDHIVDADAAVKFLLNKTQNGFMGGFNKTIDPDEIPDPLHSFLGLAALSILGHSQVGELNAQFVIPQSSYNHWLELDL